MKKNQFFGLALMAAATVMVGCKPSAEVNPTFDGENVKTAFAFNVPMGVKPGSRQAIAEVQGQATPVFQGMQKIYLASIADASVTGSSTYSAVTHLADLGTSEISTTKSSKVYKDVAIPVGTKNFLFWGESAFAGVGEITNNLNNPSVISNTQVYFQLAKSQTSADVAALEAGKTVILDNLNAVIAAFDVTNLDDVNYTGDNELKDLYNQWCQNGVYWAGAKTPVLATLADLDATLTDIETAFAVGTFSTGDHSVIDAIQAASAAATTAVTALGTNFPESANVPEGSIAYAYDNGTGKFVWQAEPVVGSGSNKVAVSSICKPASLNYFVNTPARATSDMNVGLDQAPYNTVATWDGQWNPSTGAHKAWGTQVTSASRTVALEKNINYSVARLDLSVVAEDNRSTDNAQVLAGITDNDVVINNKLTVTGVLIGGQPNYVGWDLLPTTAALTAPAGAAAPFNAATAYDQTVWDKTTLGAGNVTTSATKFMSTLVLDNNAATQKDVLIAVEFVNNTGIDFYGCNGIIKAGAKFYMVAQLHPESSLPNYNAVTCNHVFVQDHITKVTAQIAADGGLKHAYNNIPDLRSTELELGLSVDLEWQDGLEFSVDFQ